MWLGAADRSSASRTCRLAPSVVSASHQSSGRRTQRRQSLRTHWRFHATRSARTAAQHRRLLVKRHSSSASSATASTGDAFREARGSSSSRRRGYDRVPARCCWSSAVAGDDAWVPLRPPAAKHGHRYPADPPTVKEIVGVMRPAGNGRHGCRLRGLIVVLWRAGLRITRRWPSTSLTSTTVEARCSCDAASAAAARAPMVPVSATLRL